jgi:hypothetical protein
LCQLLTYAWAAPGKKPFTFDLGGRLRGGDLDRKLFVAEVKNHVKENDLPTEFSKFLGKCYLAVQQQPDSCARIFWISWSPFQAQTWDEHTTVDNVRKHVLKHRELVLNEADETKAKDLIDEDAVRLVAARLWMLTMSDPLETLVLSDDHLAELARVMTLENRSATSA